MSASSDGALPERLRTAFERGGEMGRRMLETDWSGTPLGPPHEWPDELQHRVATMLASRAQIVMFWGPDYCALYNDAYIPTMGSKHPGYLGRPGREMWAEAWAVIEPPLPAPCVTTSPPRTCRSGSAESPSRRVEPADVSRPGACSTHSAGAPDRTGRSAVPRHRA